MAQLVKPDIQSNPIGETSPNDFFNVETTQQNFFNTETDRTNIEDPNQNVSTNDIPPLNAPNLNDLIPPFLDGNPTEVYNFNENSLINGEYVPLDSDKEVRDALPSLDLNDFNFNAFDQLQVNDQLQNNDQLQVNDQLQNITESISRLHKSSKPSNQSMYSKPSNQLQNNDQLQVNDQLQNITESISRLHKSSKPSNQSMYSKPSNQLQNNDQLQVNDQLQDITESISRLHKSSKPNNQSMYSKPTSGNDYYEKSSSIHTQRVNPPPDYTQVSIPSSFDIVSENSSQYNTQRVNPLPPSSHLSSSIHTQRVNPPQYNDTQRINLPPIKTTNSSDDTQRINLPPIKTTNSSDDIPQINGKLQRRNTVNTTTKPYFIWDGSFEYFNCKKLSKKPNYKWNIENEKDKILKFFSNYPNFSKRNIQIYNVCDDPLIAFVASKSGDFKDAWKKMYSRNSEFKNYVDRHNEKVFKYFEETSEPNIREIYKEKISKYSSNENCNSNNELMKLNDEENECNNKFSDKENYIKMVISTNPCKVRYVNINNQNDYFEEEEKENNSNDPIPRNVFTNNKGTVNKGSDNEFTNNKGTVNKGSDNEFTNNKGTVNKGSDNEFTYVGTNNEGTDNEGTDNEITDDESSDNEGTDNEITDDEEDNINYPILRNNFTYVDRDNKGTDDEDTDDEDTDDENTDDENTDDENTDDEGTDNEEQSIINPPSSRINLFRDITLENEPIKLTKKKNIIKPNNKHQPVNIGKENPVKPDNTIIPKSKPVKPDNTIIPKSKPVKPVKPVKPDNTIIPKSKPVKLDNKHSSVNKSVKLDINKFSESDKIISPDKKHSSVNKSVKLDINKFSESDKIISPEKSSKFTPISSVKPDKKIRFNPNNVMPIKRVAKKYKTINPDGTIGNLLKDDQKCIDKYEIIRQFLIDTDTHIVKNRKSSK